MDDARLALILAKLERSAGTPPPGGTCLIVEVSTQTLFLVRDETVLDTYPVSTSGYGIGSDLDTCRTPLGSHRIAEKVGDGAPSGRIFRGRIDTGEDAVIHTGDTATGEDHITTRILWLEGLEPGLNSGPGVDTKERYIYIHGTPEEGLIGRPCSHGCVRMKNRDVIELFNLVSVGTPVEIVL